MSEWTQGGTSVGPREFWIIREENGWGQSWDVYSVKQVGDHEQIHAVEYSAYERVVNAMREMREHICDGGGERPCSQMWYQDVIDEALGETEAELSELKNKALRHINISALCLPPKQILSLVLEILRMRAR